MSAVQSEYSLFTRDPESGGPDHLPRAGHRLRPLQPTRPRRALRHRHQRRAVRRPATSGRHTPRFQGDNLVSNLELVARLGEVARGRGARRPARPGLGAGSGRRHRPHPRHQAPALSGGERGRARRRADPGGSRRHRGDRAPAERRPGTATPPSTWPGSTSDGSPTGRATPPLRGARHVGDEGDQEAWDFSGSRTTRTPGSTAVSRRRASRRSSIASPSMGRARW